MTSPEQYTAAADQLRRATDAAAELWQQGAKALTQQAEALSSMRVVDPTAGVQRYFELLQQAVDVNTRLAEQWSDAVRSMSEAFGTQLTTLTGAVHQQVDAAAEVVSPAATVIAESRQDVTEAAAAVAATIADRTEAAAAAQADAQAAATRKARAAERAAAKDAKEKAREPYEGLSKARLSTLLTERGLPKSGTIEALITRLVQADTGK